MSMDHDTSMCWYPCDCRYITYMYMQIVVNHCLHSAMHALVYCAGRAQCAMQWCTMHCAECSVHYALCSAVCTVHNCPFNNNNNTTLKSIKLILCFLYGAEVLLLLWYFCDLELHSWLICNDWMKPTVKFGGCSIRQETLDLTLFILGIFSITNHLIDIS